VDPGFGLAILHSSWNGQFSKYDRVARAETQCRSSIWVDDIEIGGSDFVVMAGPCSVESEGQILETAEAVRRSGAKILRGGAFKPRTSPYAFQGLGLEGLKLLAKARKETGLKVVTEVMSETDVSLIAEYADILQIGARNMENFSLLEEAGRCRRPVLLKRGMSARIEDLLHSAQIIVESGNPNVILCERGIRTFENATRNTFDISAIPVLHTVSHLPVIADPSHAAGVRQLVPALARAAAAIGADGLIVEVHPNPDKALSDGEQSLTPQMFAEMMSDLKPYLALRTQALHASYVGACR
jgi:3-deoxy-7-phosphoheptulonate synthase